jgi:hypothetical protein
MGRRVMWKRRIEERGASNVSVECGPMMGYQNTMFFYSTKYT